MEFGFREPQREYVSGSQRAKAWTEQWVSDHLFCPNCGNPNVLQLPPNMPVADFYCARCADQFELKSQKKKFGRTLANGAYSAKQERLNSATNPNLLLLSYSAEQKAVRDLVVIPKHFFAIDLVEQRKPLGPTARRAGWVGSNILLHRIPEAGRISVIRNGASVPKETVLSAWRKTVFLRQQDPSARGWLLEVMRCVETIGRQQFSIEDVYAYETVLSELYPNNQNVRPKIRQQLQVLRDNGYLEFQSRGQYRLR